MAKRTIPRTCETCQGPFLAEAHEISIGKAKFCSRACANRVSNPARRRGRESACAECGKPVYLNPCQTKRKNTFCDLICRKAFHSISNRFWKKVDKSDGQGPKGQCWQWIASKDTCGYGLLKPTSAHRVSWEIHNGPIPDSLSVLHRCDNPPCVRPEHLFLGTQKDNMQDRLAKGRYRGTDGQASSKGSKSESV